jgi:hypothetical protein
MKLKKKYNNGVEQASGTLARPATAHASRYE